jgi:hypothetical protein
MKTSEEEGLRQVREALAATAIPADQIRLWMKSPSLDVQGMIFDFLDDPGHAARIVLFLTFDDYRHFVPGYLFRCITGSPRDAWQAGNDQELPQISRAVSGKRFQISRLPEM